VPFAGMSVRRLGWMFAGLEVVTLVTVLLLKRFDGLDLEVYLGGARALVDRGSPYDVGVQTTHGILLPFTYTPFAAALFLPGTVFSFAVAMRLISIASLLAIGAVAYLYVAHLNGALRDRTDVKGHTVAVAVAIGAQLAGAVLEPVRSTLGFGQINALLMVAVVADALLPGRGRTKGLLIGLAAAVKLLPAVFVLFFLFRKDFKSAARVVGGFVAASAVMWLVAPRASTAYWTELVFQTDRIGGRDYVGNQSLRGLIARLDMAESTQTLVWLFAALLVLALTAFVIARSPEPTLALTACSLCMLLVSPVSWTHHWVWCVPILVLLGYLCVRHRRDDRRLSYWLGGLTAASTALFVIGSMWTTPRPANSLVTWLETESYELLGIVLLIALGVFASRVKPRSASAPNSGVRVAA
jgi:alpha-1,2-mannosyltransferase